MAKIDIDNINRAVARTNIVNRGEEGFCSSRVQAATRVENRARSITQRFTEPSFVLSALLYLAAMLPNISVLRNSKTVCLAQ